MPISITGTGTITGLSAGGLPDDCITTAEIASSAVTTAKLAQPVTLATGQNATGTSIDFTGIPSWVKKITVPLYNVSTNGASRILLRAISGTAVSSGYIGSGGYFGPATTGSSETTGFIIAVTTDTNQTYNGNLFLSTLGLNVWAYSSALGRDDGYIFAGGGSVALSGTLTGVRLTTANGTDSFDQGSVNIIYEG
jgi:hypothetical protein